MNDIFKKQLNKANSYLQAEKVTYSKSFNLKNYCYTNKISKEKYEEIIKTDRLKDLHLMHDGKEFLGFSESGEVEGQQGELSNYLSKQTQVVNSYDYSIKDNPLIIVKNTLLTEALAMK